jgi:hypothetical protein
MYMNLQQHAFYIPYIKVKYFNYKTSLAMCRSIRLVSSEQYQSEDTPNLILQVRWKKAQIGMFDIAPSQPQRHELPFLTPPLTLH